MAEESKTSQEYEKRKTSVSNLCPDAMKTSPCSSPIALRRSASVQRHNCLCSPTTHAGSFRCRYHRNSGLARSGMSVGSKLSELASKSTGMCDNVSHMQLVAAHRHSSSSSTYLPA